MSEKKANERRLLTNEQKRRMWAKVRKLGSDDGGDEYGG